MGFTRKPAANPPARKRRDSLPEVTTDPIIATVCLDVCVTDASALLVAAMAAAKAVGMSDDAAQAEFVKGDGVDIGACLTKILGPVSADLQEKTQCDVTELQIYLEPVLVKDEGEQPD